MFNIKIKVFKFLRFQTILSTKNNFTSSADAKQLPKNIHPSVWLKIKESDVFLKNIF